MRVLSKMPESRQGIRYLDREKPMTAVTWPCTIRAGNMAPMNATLRLPDLMNSFRSVLAVSFLIAFLSFGIPFITEPGAIDGAIKASLFLTLLWTALVIFAFTRFRWRALWLWFGLPLTSYWLVVLYLMASGCAHNIKNCP